MKRNKLLLIILILLLVISGDDANNVSAMQVVSLCASQSQIPKLECEALTALYNSTNGASWTINTGWKAIPYTPCSWYGVTCGMWENHVIELNLHSNNLNGNIPSELENLTYLQRLKLFNNHLTGNIPPELGNISNLHQLDLGSNHLTGHLPPKLGNLSQLENLFLIYNPLTGPIPANFTNLNLTVFAFHHTELCEPQDSAFQTWLSGVAIVDGNGVACFIAPTPTATKVPPTKTAVPPTATLTLLPTFTPTVVPPTETAVPEAIQEADMEDETDNEEQEAMIPEPTAVDNGQDDQQTDFKTIVILLVALVGILIMVIVFILINKKK